MEGRGETRKARKHPQRKEIRRDFWGAAAISVGRELVTEMGSAMLENRRVVAIVGAQGLGTAVYAVLALQSGAPVAAVLAVVTSLVIGTGAAWSAVAASARG